MKNPANNPRAAGQAAHTPARNVQSHPNAASAFYSLPTPEKAIQLAIADAIASKLYPFADQLIAYRDQHAALVAALEAALPYCDLPSVRDQARTALAAAKE